MVANLFTLVIDRLRFVKIRHTLEACRGLGKSWCNVLGTLKSSCLHLVFGPLFTPYPLFEWGLQSKEVLLNLGMKCWNSAANAQFELTIVVVHVGVVKIYVAPVEALRKKERRVKIGWNSVWHKKWCISEFLPPWRLMYFFTCFLKSQPVLDQIQRTGALFSWLYGKLY